MLPKKVSFVHIQTPWVRGTLQYTLYIYIFSYVHDPLSYLYVLILLTLCPYVAPCTIDMETGNEGLRKFAWRCLLSLVSKKKKKKWG